MKVLSFLFLYSVISTKTVVTFVCLAKSQAEFHKWRILTFIQNEKSPPRPLVIFHAQNIREGAVRTYLAHAHAYSYFALCASAFS